MPSRYRAAAKRRWPAAHISGDGPHGSLSLCPSGGTKYDTLYLYQTRKEAEAAKRLIDNTGCGGSCQGNHHLVEL